ncbi:hypothetical protein HUJ04_008553 [Dendroctonus ponderosae]|nr:hypothetical protein HUJ04_008553 [Dendroctonus ponderosae]
MTKPVEACFICVAACWGNLSIFCSICGAVFKHVASLKYHVANQVCTKPRKDEEARKLQCPVCDKAFKGITAMQYHIRRRVCEQVKVNVGPPFACKLCGTLFNLKQSWYVHMRREACKKFPDKYGLNTNKFSPKVILQEDHSDTFLQFDGADMQDYLLRFECSKCGKRYKHSPSLYNHKRFECGVEPQFKCGICDYVAKRKHALKMHSLKHTQMIATEDGRFLCRKCCKKYASKQLVLSHVLFECGVQPIIQCHLCPRKCRKKDVLEMHLKNIHGIHF